MKHIFRTETTSGSLFWGGMLSNWLKTFYKNEETTNAN